MHRHTQLAGTVGAALVAALVLGAAASAAPRGPNGLVAFASNRSGQSEIYVANPDGSGRTALGAPGSSPQWSPDGSRIAFGSNRDGNSEIYVMNADGSDQTRLTFNPGYDSRPQWTADGQHLVFTRILPPFNWEIFEMNADGSQQTNVTSSDALEWGQTTAPRGNKIAFTREDAGVGHIYSMNTNGSDVRQLTSTASYDEYPSWSPTGNDIVFTRDDGHGSDLWIMHANGTAATQVTHQSRTGYIYAGSWSPDGAKIIYTQCGPDASGPCTLHTANADGGGDVDASTPRAPYLDTFTGDRIDPFWSSGAYNGSGPSIDEQNGLLHFDVPSSTTNGPAGYATADADSQCLLQGDFDMQVDYSLLVWPLLPPGVNGVNLNFGVNFTHTLFVHQYNGQTSVSTFFPDVSNVFADAPGATGSLRLTRSGDMLTGYYLGGTGWIPLLSGPLSSPDAFVQLSIFTNDPPFSHPDVQVAFDNFRISSGTFSCPSWWSDSGADWQSQSGK
jgi:dipeptidyl aminopeptidase/acylaminoacyl peptidase